MDLEAIKRHWEEAGKQFPTEGHVTPTSRDPYLGQLEEENISSRLAKHHVVLELGCGDGAHTVNYARRVKRLSGVDLTASFLDLASQRATAAGLENVDFTPGSILELNSICQGRQFDCIISQRCLINLPEWHYQQDTILQSHSLLEPGGLFLLTEGFQEELDNINATRRQFGLPAIVVAYNRCLVRADFTAFVARHFEILEVRHYGAYLFLSRVLHPLAVWPDSPKHDARLNEVAMEITRVVPMPDLDRYSYNSFYVLGKKCE